MLYAWSTIIVGYNKYLSIRDVGLLRVLNAGALPSSYSHFSAMLGLSWEICINVM